MGTEFDRMLKEQDALIAQNQYQFMKNINDALKEKNVADMREYCIGFNVYIGTLNAIQVMNIRSQKNG